MNSKRQTKPGRTARWELLKTAALVPMEHRIYVNRNLRMSRLEALGFDMDHTLALYNAAPFEELAFEESKKKLLQGGYPSEVGSLRYDSSFIIRGLVVDKRRGNILKMDQHRYVARATHGTAPLPDRDRKTIYQQRLVRLSAGPYVPVDSPFSLPEIDLYAQIVDLADRQGWKQRSYSVLYDDVRRAVDEAHADGSIKRHIAQDPARYLLPDPALPETLQRLKEHGYKLFLLTNSEASHTAVTMNHLLGGKLSNRSRWTEFFDLIIVRAGKPDFFQSRTPAMSVRLPGVRAKQEAAKAFAGGGVHDLERRLGCGGDRILFFGDHTYGDILKSKRVCFWRTAMILQELETEIATLERLSGRVAAVRRKRAQKEDLDRIRDYVVQSANGWKTRVQNGVGRNNAGRILEDVDQKLLRMEDQLRRLELQCDNALNIHWGPTFRTGQEPSYFAGQLREFACIYTARVSNFLYYPADKYFQVRADMMPHER